LRKYLDPAVLAQLQGLELKAKLVVEGNLSGMHKSPFKGFSVEFAEHKSYFPGDDIRYIDWKLYGKSEKFFIKQYEEDTNLKSYLLLDTSKSMGFPEKSQTKLEYSIFLTVAMSYLMLSQRDSVGLLTFNDSICDYIPPRNEMSHLHYIVDILEKIKPANKTSISHSLKYLASKIKRRGLIILISDLVDDQENVLKHLAYLRKMKHEIIVFHIMHPDEVNIPYHGTVKFKNMENHGEITAIPDRIRNNYSKNLQNFINTYQQNCWQEKIDYHRIITSVPVEKAILNYIAGRKKV